ncbi:DUF4139 domain-containing protein [Flavobacterium sp.]|uniref:DUF4139 domain-containing protein n=1 Tax=Flavobacterium sp. TaxID=239 RepID=UPI0035272FE8
MKKIFFISILLSISNIALAQNPIYTKAKVIEVNAYRNNAELKNTTSFSIPAGNSEVVIGNISEEIIENSLQIALDNKNVSILSSQFTDDYSSDFKIDTTNPQLKKVADSIEIVNNLIVKSNIEIDANTKTIELLDKNQTVLVGSSTSNVTQLTQLTDYYTAKRIEISNKLVKLRDTNIELQKKLNRLKSSLKTKEEKELDEYASGVLVLKLYSKVAANCKVEIKYLAQQVYWEPLYEINGSSINEPLTVFFKASLRQNTGLDWKGVKLSLINGNPSQNKIAPVIEPWFIYAENKEDNMVIARGIPRKINDAEYSSNQLDELVVTGAGFSINSNELNISYDVAIPYDIQANNEPHLISLFDQKIPAKFTYFTVPNYIREAFLLAKIDNFSKYGFISAKAKIIFENMYIGETYINPSQTEDELPITLGNDNRISVKRVEVKDKSSEKFLSSNVEKTVTYDLVIRNNKKQNITIEIKDRYPISNNEAVKVELLERSGAKVDDEKGFLTWNEKISASETKTIRVSYKVKYPKDYSISNF